MRMLHRDRDMRMLHRRACARQTRVERHASRVTATSLSAPAAEAATPKTACAGWLPHALAASLGAGWHVTVCAVLACWCRVARHSVCRAGGT